ncbi:MAG TPA: FkbM family methyltransferase [Usitatibacter sp.]|nr:FkbM family methyltransferase [Usitatibacter sp.]
MIEVAGIWIPDDEEYLRRHLDATPGFADAYDAELIAMACALARRRVAVDVGANVGLWSRRLVQSFAVVHAFEPLKAARSCFLRNVVGASLHPEALGDRNGTVAIRQKPTGEGSTTTLKTHVVRDSAAGETDLRTLDSFGFDDVDLVKIDAEGFDYFVLVGAEETIRKWRPAIVFEAKPGVSEKRYGVADDAPCEWLEARGYAVRYEERGNFFMEAKE